MKNIILVLFVLITLFTINHCSENSTKPPLIVENRDTITISIEQVTHRSISVGIQKKLNLTKDRYVLNRISGVDTVAFTPFSLSRNDSVFIDDNNGEGLIIDADYSYFAFRLDSNSTPSDTSNIITAKTLAPTIHDFIWTEYLIGEGQSELKDVWGSRNDNVYAVGTIHLNDTTYGIIKWNGLEWKGVDKVGGRNTIFGFNENDIWEAGNGVKHFDGINWNDKATTWINSNFVILDEVLANNGPYLSIWGTSSENLYFCSGTSEGKGRIVHWDGNKGRLDFQTNDFGIIHLSGTATDNIWAVGHGNGGSQDIVLHFDGISWKNSNSLPFNPVAPTGVVSFNLRENYISGNGGVYFGYTNYWKSMSIPTNIRMEEVNGYASNDLFAVGSFTEILHYNGFTWYKYEELSTSGGKMNAIWAFENSVFVAGYNSNLTNGKILIGKRQER